MGLLVFVCLLTGGCKNLVDAYSQTILTGKKPDIQYLIASVVDSH